MRHTEGGESVDPYPARKSSNSLDRPRPRPARETYRVGRAGFLAMLGVGAGALFLGKRSISVPSLSFPGGGQAEAGFTIYTVTGGYPPFHSSGYRLTIDGMVEKPLSLTIGQLLRAPAVQEVDNYQCVTGWKVPGVRWTGIRLATLLKEAHPKPGALGLTFYSFDGTYTESLTVAQSMSSDVLLAYKLNHRPLSQAQGAPLRLVVPGMYGYKYIKWVNRIELVGRPIDGYWERNGYDRDAYIGRSNNHLG